MEPLLTLFATDPAPFYPFRHTLGQARALNHSFLAAAEGLTSASNHSYLAAAESGAGFWIG